MHASERVMRRISENYPHRSTPSPPELRWGLQRVAAAFAVFETHVGPPARRVADPQVTSREEVLWISSQATLNTPSALESVIYVFALLSGAWT
jgi:hypothetical protein